MKYYLVKSASEVNTILWDGVSSYTPPDGWTLMDEATFIAWRNDNPAPAEKPKVPSEASPAYLRIALRRLHEITPAMVSSKIELIPDANDRQDAEDLWEYATSIRRNHPLVASIAILFALTEEQIDEVFRVAVSLSK